jgi:hypothetical protein
MRIEKPARPGENYGEKKIEKKLKNIIGNISESKGLQFRDISSRLSKNKGAKSMGGNFAYVTIRFYGNKEVIDSAIECLKVQLKDNIKCRRTENKDNSKHIEAEITSIK